MRSAKARIVGVSLLAFAAGGLFAWIFAELTKW